MNKSPVTIVFGLSAMILPTIVLAQSDFTHLSSGKQEVSPTTTPGSKPQTLKLSMATAVSTALAKSKTLKISAEAVARAHGRTNEQKDGYNPILSTTTTITHLDSGSTITLPGSNGAVQTIPIVLQDQTQLALQASVPIDFSGLIRAAVQQSEFQEIVSRLDYNRARNQTVLDVKNAYYDVLRAKAFVIVADESVKNSQDRQSTAELNLKVGTGTKFDVLRAQTDVANAQQSQISAKNRVNLAAATLNNVLNLDQNTPIDIEESAEKGSDSGQIEFNAAVAEAYKNRPEVLQAEANIRASEKGIRIAERSILPSVGLGAGYNFTPNSGGFAPKLTSWAVTGTITFPIFDQGLSRSRTDQAKADVKTAILNKQVTQDSVALDVRQNYLALTEAQDRLNVTSAALAQAQEQFRLAQVRFKAGVTSAPGASPLLEISDAQTALTQAQSNRVNAQYDLLNSRARLDRAIGRYAFDGNASPGLASPNELKPRK